MALLQVVGPLVLVAYLRRRPREQVIVTGLAIAYEIAICLSLAFVDFCVSAPAIVPESRVSWVCIAIVLFPALVPARPRTMLMASLASAAMTPIGYALSLPVTRARSATTNIEQ